ncbi:MAG: hypothetical protein JKX85_12435 [Phycisphaeraceae bacterium]|nr:hypothetical protein [Phycisphaeraceae bacterium]
MTARFGEFRRCGDKAYEGLEQLIGTEGCFYETDSGQAQWGQRNVKQRTPLTTEQMRDPLPAEVLSAWDLDEQGSAYGNHQGSHPYLVHEFVDAIAHNRIPAINAWEAARYLAPGVIAHKSAMKDGQWLDVPDWGDGQSHGC